MVFEELISETAERLNLSSDEAKSRIGRNLQNRYRRVTTGIGLQTSRYIQVSKVATIGNRTMTFSGIEKIRSVLDKKNPKSPVVLSEITLDEMNITPLRKDPPRHYAVTAMHPTSVDIVVDSSVTTAFTLYADGHTTVVTLAGNQAPDFPESFHEILIFGAMADEYRKMEKLAFAQEAELNYEKRLSDLRYFISKSAYLDIHQGRYTGKTFRWTRDAQLLWDS